MTTSPTSALEFYDSNLESFNRLEAEAKFILEDEIDFKVHSVPTRVKERESVKKKLTDKQYTDPANEMVDVVGLRIVSLFESDLDKADAAINRAFKVLSREDKIAEAADDTFGYMSIHYTCVLKDSNQGARYRGLHGLKFEVQSRTILMDAWANVSHYLAYKGKRSIPATKQRAFYALAGLFYLADQQFEQLLTGSGQSQVDALTMPETSVAEQALDRDRMEALLDQVFPTRSRGDDEEEYLGSLSDLVEEASAAGFETVGEFRALLERGRSKATAYEKRYPPNATPGDNKYSKVGMARVAAGIASSRFGDLRGKQRADKYAEFR